MIDFINQERASSDAGGHGAHGGPSGGARLFGIKVQNIKIPPMITFDEDFGGRRISGVIIALVDSSWGIWLP